MRRCDRCGEHNHDDARYCGICGLAMPDEGSVESLVAGGTDQESPGADELRSSEYVGAPSYGETGPVTGPPPAPIITGPTTVAPPPTASPPTGTAPTTRPPGGPGIEPTTVMHVAGSSGTPTAAPLPPTRSSSVVLAALAVAAVMILGGVFVLLSFGSGGTEVARTGDEPSESPTSFPTPTEPPSVVVPPDTIRADTVPGTVAPDTVLPDTVLPDSVAPDTVLPDDVLSTSMPDVAAPASTAAPTPVPPPPPEPAPTTPPAPSRGPGDLGLTQPILNESCDGRYITFVGSAVGDRDYRSAVGELLDTHPGSNYIWTKACPSLRQEFTNGADIYGVVFGPYATQQEACNARAAGPIDAYVRRISTFDPADHTITC